MQFSFADITAHVEKGWLETALLQHQYFPNVRSDRTELPPFFDTSTFSTNVAATLRQHKPKNAPVLEFRSRRYDGLIRTLGIPHPVPYAILVNHVVDHWVDLAKFLRSDQSMVKPDGWPFRQRVVVMDYESSGSKMRRDAIAAQGSRYVVRADVANCFPSIYSHAIDWALRGKAVAKTDSKRKAWQARLDELLRNCHGRETKGVMIGPAISNIAAEIVLQRIDADLVNDGFEFVRYVDDFTSYHATLEDAEKYVSRLDLSLAHYRLQLNTRKTRITALADDSDGDWISEILSALPNKKRAGVVKTLRFVRHCEILAKRYPQQSVLTFGIKSLLGKRGCPLVGRRAKRTPSTADDVTLLHELLRLTFLHPHLIPFTVRQLAYCSEVLSAGDRDRLVDILHRILREAARRRETSTVTWGVYAVRKLLRRDIPKELAMILIELNDDLVWVSLMASGRKYVRWVNAHLADLLLGGGHDVLDHWLTRYELYRIAVLKSDELDKDVEAWFRKARPAGLRFSILE